MSSQRNLTRHLVACSAMAAGAAGAMAPMQDASADIIFSGPLSISVGTTSASVGDFQIFIDPIGGVIGVYTDKSFSAYDFYFDPEASTTDSEWADFNAKTNFVATYTYLGVTLADPLSFGTTIDSSLTWTTGGSVDGYYDGPPAKGMLLPGTSVYTGIKVESDVSAGVYYYGWVGVTTDAARSTVTITGVAFEDSPGVGITAGAVPEPASSSLAALALGAGALASWRRRRLLPTDAE